jgi:hypothetical protein
MFGELFVGNVWKVVCGECLEICLWGMFGKLFVGNVWKDVCVECLESWFNAKGIGVFCIK